jgi:hypothetical protein
MLIVVACIVLVMVTTLLHYEVLRLLSVALPRLRVPARAKLIGVILGTFVAHVGEILIYAGAIYFLVVTLGQGDLGSAGPQPFSVFLYFSAETFTSLGHGDVIPVGDLRLIAGAETLNGLLLIGWSASYAYISMERYWNAGAEGPRGAGPGKA